MSPEGRNAARRLWLTTRRSHTGNQRTKQMNYYTLTDTFNVSVISQHRTVLAAVKAKYRHARAVVRRNGRGSYVPYRISSTLGENIVDEIIAAEHQIYYGI